MTVTAVASSQTTTARQTLAGNFDTFLKLLTTQLKQQDPLAPMDSTQF
jgi:flagellar basal-body rod modification protein FlgD